MSYDTIIRNGCWFDGTGQLAPRLDPRTFTLDTVADAYQAVENRSSARKLVVTVE